MKIYNVIQRTIFDYEILEKVYSFRKKKDANEKLKELWKNLCEVKGIDNLELWLDEHGWVSNKDMERSLEYDIYEEGYACRNSECAYIEVTELN